MRFVPTRCSLALTAALAATLAACGASGPRAATSAAPMREGKYSFVERPAGTGVSLEGSFVVLGDTVIVDATPGPCHYESNSTRGGPIVYRCADVTLSFDRNDPVRRAQYSFNTVEQQKKTTCVRYDTNSRGQRVCAETQVEFVDKNVPHYGTLRPQRGDGFPPD